MRLVSSHGPTQQRAPSREAFESVHGTLRGIYSPDVSGSLRQRRTSLSIPSALAHHRRLTLPGPPTKPLRFCFQRRYRTVSQARTASSLAGDTAPAAWCAISHNLQRLPERFHRCALPLRYSRTLAQARGAFPGLASYPSPNAAPRATSGDRLLRTAVKEEDECPYEASTTSTSRCRPGPPPPEVRHPRLFEEMLARLDPTHAAPDLHRRGTGKARRPTGRMLPAMAGCRPRRSAHV